MSFIFSRFPLLYSLLTKLLLLSSCNSTSSQQHISPKQIALSLAIPSLVQAIPLTSRTYTSVPTTTDTTDLNNVLFPIVVEVSNNTSTTNLADVDPADLKFYFPELTNKSIEELDTKEENSEKITPIAAIAFTQSTIENVLRFGWKRYFASERSRWSFSGDHGAQITLAKSGVYVILMSVAFYLELHENFRSPDLFTLWSNASISIINVAADMYRSDSSWKNTTSLFSACLNTIPAIVITSVNPTSASYNPSIISTWFATADHASNTGLRVADYVENKRRDRKQEKAAYDRKAIGTSLLITSSSTVISSLVTAGIL